MSQDLLSAVGNRIEAQLKQIEARFKSADMSRAQRSAGAEVAFVLPTSSTYAATAATAANVANNADSSGDSAGAQRNSYGNSNANIEIGASFRPKGASSDAPMTIEHIENGMIYTSFSNGVSAGTLSFKADEIDIVEKQAAPPMVPDNEFFPHFVELVKQAVVMEQATENAPAAAGGSNAAALAASAGATDMSEHFPTAVATAVTTAAAANVADTVPQSNTNPTSTPTTTGPSNTTPNNSSNNTVTPTTPVNNTGVGNTGALRVLPDGTLQFGYAPTGPITHDGASTTPPVPAEYGVGATFRRKGVIPDVPMTVTRVGDGVFFARPTFPNGLGQMMDEFAFYPDQVDLLTPAP